MEMQKNDLSPPPTLDLKDDFSAEINKDHIIKRNTTIFCANSFKILIFKIRFHRKADICNMVRYSFKFCVLFVLDVPNNKFMKFECIFFTILI